MQENISYFFCVILCVLNGIMIGFVQSVTILGYIPRPDIFHSEQY
jgi:hypothetical protein